MTDTTPPIIVNPSPLPDQVGAVIRYVITTVGGYLVGRGYLTNEQASLIGGLVIAVAPLAYALWNTTRKKKQLVIVANAAPNGVAQVRPS